jgi:hypothetical protein
MMRLADKVTARLKKKHLDVYHQKLQAEMGGGLHNNGSGKSKVGLEMGTCEQDDENLVCTKCG